MLRHPPETLNGCVNEHQRKIVARALEVGVTATAKEFGLNRRRVNQIVLQCATRANVAARAMQNRPLSDYEPFISYANQTQLDLLEAWRELGCLDKASAKVGITRRAATKRLLNLEKNAARRGVAPGYDMTKPAAPGYQVKGTSTLYDKEGKVAAQWVKTTQSAEDARRALEAFAEDLAEGIEGIYKARHRPKTENTDLMALYPVGDPHFGMMSYALETGENFDLKIAESLTQQAIDRLVASAPACETGVLLNLGDLLHADNQSNLTRSGHQLDVDGRWTKVVQVALRSLIYCVDRMLSRHQFVVVRNNAGNHDSHSGHAISLMMQAYYRAEPRVMVDCSPSPFWYHAHGKVLIGSCHGDTAKGPALPGIMAADKPELWGATKYRYWMVGHVHHVDTKEYPGAIVEYHRTLAARDAWHTSMGYRAGRDMKVIVYHRDFGEIERHRCDVAMLSAA